MCVGRAASSRDGAVIAVLTVSASAGGIDQILWMKPVKITAVSVPG